MQFSTITTLAIAMFAANSAIAIHIGGNHFIENDQLPSFNAANTKCTYPDAPVGKISCWGDYAGSIAVCGSDGNWATLGKCGEGEKCGYISGTPYCIKQ